MVNRIDRSRQNILFRHGLSVQSTFVLPEATPSQQQQQQHQDDDDEENGDHDLDEENIELIFVIKYYRAGRLCTKLVDVDFSVKVNLARKHFCDLI